MTHLLKKIVVTFTAVAILLMGVGFASAVQAEETSAEEYEAQIESLMKQIEELQAQKEGMSDEEPANIEGIPADYQFDGKLAVGDRGEDVKHLQRVLNSQEDTKLADSGVGSSGEETEYFGQLTKAAVIEFQEKYQEDVLGPYDLTEGTGYVGKTTMAKLNDILDDLRTDEADDGEEDDGDDEDDGDEVTGEGLEVALADDNPEAGYVLIDKENSAEHQKEMVKYEMNAEEDTTVDEITFTRGGYVSDGDISELYLYVNGELVDTTPSNSATTKFRFSSEFELEEGSNDVELRMDPDNEMKESVVRFGIASADDIDSDIEVNGDFPINGNNMNVADVDLAEVNVDSDVHDVSNLEVGTTDEKLAEFVVDVTDNDVTVDKMAFEAIGSLSENDLANFSLVDEDGDVVAEEASLNDSKKLVFEDLDLDLESGTHIYDLEGDIKGGSGRDFRFAYDEALDFDVTDNEQGVKVAVGSDPDLDDDGGSQDTQEIETGDFNMELSDDSPLGDVALDSKNVVVAEYEFTSGGEKTKVENLSIPLDLTDDNSNGTPALDDVKILVDGSQKGNTTSSMEDGETTTYDFGNSFIVPLGETATVQVVADLDNDNLESGDEFQITEGSADYELMESDQSTTGATLEEAYKLKATDVDVSASLSNSTPDSQTVAMGDTVEAGRWNVEAYNGDDEIDSLSFHNDTAIDDDIKKAKAVLYDGDGNEVESIERSVKENDNDSDYGVYFGNDSGIDEYDSQDDLNWDIPQGENYEIALEYTYRDWASTDSGADSGFEVTPTFKEGEFKEAGTKTVNSDANSMLLRRAIPTIAMDGSAEETLSSGSGETLYSFDLSADKSRISLKQIKYNIDINGEVEFSDLKLYRGGTELTNVDLSSSTIDEADSPTDLTVTLDDGHEEELLAGDSFTYHLKANVSGVADDTEATIRIDEDASKPDPDPDSAGDLDGNNIVWSDQSAGYQDHASDTEDWTNGYLVNEMPTTKKYWIE